MPSFVFSSFMICFKHWNDSWSGAFTLALGTVYFVLLITLFGKPELTTFRYRYSITAIALLAIATAIEFSDFALGHALEC